MNELEILQQQAYQTIPRLDKANISPLFRGRPEIESSWSKAEMEKVMELCPTGAVRNNPIAIDLSKCVFCKVCALHFPEKIRFTNDYNVASNDLNALMITPDVKEIGLNASLIRAEIRSYFGKALKLRQVSAGGDNSAEMELNACGNVNFDMGRYGIEFVASPRHADGLVITGPITKNMMAALETCYVAVPSPKILILAGTDAISGGVFAGNKELSREFLQKYPVDLIIPGNPPHPLSVINGILRLVRSNWPPSSVSI